MNPITRRKIARLYQAIYNSLFTFTGQLSYDRTQDALIALCDALTEGETDEFIWSEVGEHTECDLGELVVGAYWHFVSWHDGRKGYQTLSKLGEIYSPGCEIEDEDHPAYIALEQMAQAV